MKSSLFSLIIQMLMTIGAAAHAQTNTFPATGSVGIGTLAPATLLTVGDGSTSSTPVLTIDGGTNTGAGPYIQFRRGGSSYGYIGMASPLSGENNNNLELFVNNALEFVMSGYSGSSAAITFTTNGAVGIGTPTPQANLDVNGVARLKVNSAQPSACTATINGTIALSSRSTLCICKGATSSWVLASNGTSACSW